ncbi:MAG: response regulator [Deltaproteobacteria bacterium]|nr:response regulator [Deltaproteobacteria bacterium]
MRHISSASGGEERKTVLIAEDNTQSRRLLKDHLEALGYSVVAAVDNGEEAVSEAKRLHPSLVILDLKMPRMGGFDAAKIISSLISVPIVVVTGYSSEELAAEAVESGVFGYIVKPLTRKQLLPAIKLAFERYRQFQELKKEVMDLKDAVEARKLIERAKGILMKRCNIGEEEAFKLLQSHSQKENKKMREIAGIVIEASKLI